VATVLEDAETAGATVPGDVVSEPGPWNDAFLSTEFRVFDWLFFFGCALVLVFGLLQLFGVMWRSFVVVDIRIKVIVASQVAIIFYVVSISLFWHAWTRVLFDGLANLIFSLCLYYILVFWLETLRQAEIHALSFPFRVLLGLGAAAAVWLFSVILVDSLRPPDALSQTLLISGWASVAGVNLIIIAIFSVQAIGLLRHRAVVKKQISSDATVVLLRLVILVPLAILASWAHFSIYCATAYIPEVAGSVGSVVAIWWIGRLAFLLRAAGFVIGLSMRNMADPVDEDGEVIPESLIDDWK